MRKLSTIALLSSALFLGACNQTSPTHNQTTKHTTQGTAASDILATHSPTGRWFVELEGEPGGLSTQSLISQQQSVLLAAQSAGIQFEEEARYHTLFNGFSLKIDNSNIAAFSQLDDVKAVYPVLLVSVPETEENSNIFNYPIGADLTGADQAHTELGLTGKGVKVGVIDSGIDLDHPAFTGRIVTQHDYVGDEYGKNGNYIPKPDEVANDCGGHGSHVAGIIGGNDPSTGFKGVAPDVSFGAYRVFGCDGQTGSDIILQAMERAYQDGMDVVNMSLGAAAQWPEYPTATAADSLVKKGVVVSIAAGNEQTYGQFASGAPALSEKSISVAAVYNSNVNYNTLKVDLGDETVTMPSALGEPAPIPQKGSSYEVVLANPLLGCNVNGKNPFAADAYKGKAVLIQRGECFFSEKAANAAAAGASAVILYNHSDGIRGVFFGETEAKIPFFSISKANGEKIKAELEAGKTPKVTFTGEKINVKQPQGGGITNFSSYGASPDLELKPELAAPGGNIYSVQNGGGYVYMDGTSMAAPHVAGAAALLLGENSRLQRLSPEEIKTRFMNTASHLNYFNNGEFTELPLYTQLQGAGLLQIPRAYTTELLAVPNKLSLGESDYYNTRSKVVVLKNYSDNEKVLTVYHQPALTLADVDSKLGDRQRGAIPNNSQAYVEINGQNAQRLNGQGGVQVSVPAHGEAELNILITAPSDAPDLSQYGGFIVAKGTGSEISIPYSGFKGDYQKLPVLGDPVIEGTPLNLPAFLIPKPFNVFFENETPEKMPVVNLQNRNIPTLLVNFAHPARELVLEAVVTPTNGQITGTHEIFRRPFVGATGYQPNGIDENFEMLPWNGKYSNGDQAPDGFYKLQLRILKALGNPDNPDHWVTYTSPEFEIDREAKVESQN